MKLLFCLCMVLGQMISGTAPRTVVSGAPTCSDSFTVTGPLSANWTQTTASGYPAAVTQTSGSVSSTARAMATHTSGCTFGPSQTSQIVDNNDTGVTGLVVRMTVAGDGYAWLFSLGAIYRLTAGGGTVLAISCPPGGHPGRVMKLSASGSTLTCTDVTGVLSASVIDSTYTAGNPGVITDPGGILDGPWMAQ